MKTHEQSELLNRLLKLASEEEVTEEMSTLLDSGGAVSRSALFVPGRGWYYLKEEADPQTGKSIAQSIAEPMQGLTGSSKITFCSGIHFKFNPKKPGIEYAVHALDALLFPDTVTDPSLFIKLHLPGQPIQEVLATQTVYGKTADKLPENELAFSNFTQQLLLQLITAPGDGKLDNFIVSQAENVKILIGIDNEINFEPEIVERINHKGHISYVHSFLFFLPQMQAPLDDNLIAHFKSLNIEKLFLVWLRDLQARNELYDRLERPQLKVLFDEGALKSVYRRLKAIQHFFRNASLESHPAITGTNLFKAVMPDVYAYYEGITHACVSQSIAAKIAELQKGKRGDEETLTFERLTVPLPDDPKKIISEEKLKASILLRQQGKAQHAPIQQQWPVGAIEQLMQWVDPKQQSEEDKRTFHEELRSGQSQLKRLFLQGADIDAQRLLSLAKGSNLVYLELENTPIGLDDLRQLMALPGCSELEICLGLNMHLGLDTWRFILRSPLFIRASLKLPQGQRLLLKGKKTEIDRLEHEYLSLLSKQNPDTEEARIYARWIETLLIEEGYPLKSFDYGLSKLEDKTRASFMILTLRYVIKMHEQQQSNPLKYLEHSRRLTKFWREVFYQQLMQDIHDSIRLTIIQASIGNYPDSDGERRTSAEKEQQFRSRLNQLTGPAQEQSPPQIADVIQVEGPTSGKAQLNVQLHKQLIEKGWLVVVDETHVGDFNFSRKQQATQPAAGTISGFQHGNHFVVPIIFEGKKFHLKVMPDFPGMEMAYSLLTNRIMGQGAPQVELWRWHFAEKTYPVLLSETIEGENLTPELLQNFPLDLYAYQQQMIMTLLFNPGDANPGNYIAQKTFSSDGTVKLRLIGVDNDRLFAPPFEAGRLRTVSVLYCFDEIQAPLHVDLRDLLLTLNAYEVLSWWLSTLEALNQHYLSIFSREELTKFMQAGDKNQPSYLLSLLKRGSITELFTKFKALQYWINSDPKITLADLLGKLHPSLANHYQQVRVNYSGVIERFEQAVKNDYRKENIAGVKRYTSTVHMMQYLKMQGREVTIDKTPMHYWQHDFAQAKKELNDLSVDRSLIELAREQLLQGQTKNFEELTQAYAQEEVLASLNLDKQIKNSDGSPDVQRQLAILDRIVNAAIKQPFERLSIQHCHITEIQLEKLLQKLPFLRVLKISHCPKLDSIFYRLDALKLNALEELMLQDMPTVTRFYFTSQTLRYIAIKQAPKLKSVTIIAKSLIQLNISHCIQCEGFDIKAPLLKEADFSGDSLLTEVHLQQIVLHSPELKHINLQECDSTKIEYKEVKSKIPAFAERILREQNEEGKSIFIATAGILTEMMKNQTRQLSFDDRVAGRLGDLELDRKGLSGWAWKCVCQALLDNVAIHHISVKSHYLITEDAICFAQVLAQNQFIQTVILGHPEGWGQSNKIGHQGGIALARALEQNVSVISMELGGNTISDKGAAAMGAMLAYNKTLTYLALDRNGISSKGAIALANGLKANRSLVNISLSANTIGDEGGIAIAEALEHNTALRSAYLEYTGIGGKGVLALAKVLTINQKVTVYLVSDGLDPALIKTLQHSRLHFKKSELLVERHFSNNLGYGFLRIARSVVAPITSRMTDTIASKTAYDANQFQINPFAFFTEQVDREKALFYVQRQEKELKYTLKKALSQWERKDIDRGVSHELTRIAIAFGFRCTVVKRDGNCLFEAVSQQIKVIFPDKKEHYGHQELRTMAVKHVMENQGHYEGFVDDRSFTSFIHKMAQPGTWAEHIVLQALAHELNVTMVVLNSDDSAPIILKKPSARGIIYLGYEVNAHYHALNRDLEMIPERSIEPWIERADALGPIQPVSRQFSTVNFN